MITITLNKAHKLLEKLKNNDKNTMKSERMMR